MTTTHTDTTLELASMIGGQPADGGASTLRLDQPGRPRGRRGQGPPRRRGHGRWTPAAARAGPSRDGRRCRPPVRGNVIAQRRRARPAQQGRAGGDRHARDRQADRGGARRGAGGDRHLRVLPQRGPSPVRHDRPVGDARQAAVHVPHARSGSRRSSPPATSRSRCRRGTSRRRCCAATRSCGSRPSTRRRAPGRLPSCSGAPACPADVLNLALADGASTFDGLEQALDAGSRAEGRVHRFDRRRPSHRRAVRPAPPVAVPRARRQEPAGRDARCEPRPGRRGRPVQRFWHRRPAVHVARHGDRPRARPRRVPRALRAGGRGGRDRRSHGRRALRPDARRAVSWRASSATGSG